MESQEASTIVPELKEGRDFLSDLMKNAQRERSSFMPNQIQQSRSSLN